MVMLALVVGMWWRHDWTGGDDIEGRSRGEGEGRGRRRKE